MINTQVISLRRPPSSDGPEWPWGGGQAVPAGILLSRRQYGDVEHHQEIRARRVDVALLDRRECSGRLPFRVPMVAVIG